MHDLWQYMNYGDSLLQSHVTKSLKCASKTPATVLESHIQTIYTLSMPATNIHDRVFL